MSELSQARQKAVANLWIHKRFSVFYWVLMRLFHFNWGEGRERGKYFCSTTVKRPMEQHFSSLTLIMLLELLTKWSIIDMIVNPLPPSTIIISCTWILWDSHQKRSPQHLPRSSSFLGTAIQFEQNHLIRMLNYSPTWSCTAVLSLCCCPSMVGWVLLWDILSRPNLAIQKMPTLSK